MKTTIQIKLQSNEAINIFNKLGRNKRIFLEQAICYYASKLDKEDRLDIFIDTKPIVNKIKEVKEKIEEKSNEKYSFDY